MPQTNGWRGNPSPRTKLGRNTTLSWGFGVRTICPAVGRRWLIFLARYPASRSFLISFSRTVEAIHLPPAPDAEIFGRPLWAEKTNAWALELEREGMDKQRERKAWVKKGSSYLLMKAAGILRLPTCPVNSLIPQAPRLMARLGYPHPY